MFPGFCRECEYMGRLLNWPSTNCFAPDASDSQIFVDPFGSSLDAFLWVLLAIYLHSNMSNRRKNKYQSVYELLDLAICSFEYGHIYSTSITHKSEGWWSIYFRKGVAARGCAHTLYLSHWVSSRFIKVTGTPQSICSSHQLKSSIYPTLMSRGTS